MLYFLCWVIRLKEHKIWWLKNCDASVHFWCKNIWFIQKYMDGKHYNYHILQISDKVSLRSHLPWRGNKSSLGIIPMRSLSLFVQKAFALLEYNLHFLFFFYVFVFPNFANLAHAVERNDESTKWLANEPLLLKWCGKQLRYFIVALTY